MNNIKLKSVEELKGLNFWIPSYQRGYRWVGQQVSDLLNDIDEFINKKNKDAFYCLQPLVVKETIPDKQVFIDALPKEETENILQTTKKAIADNTRWEVIDGQQRLTTIYILLFCLEQGEPYSIIYQTRGNSASFLGNIKEENSNDNIDYYHMFLAKKTIEAWFRSKDDPYKETFKKTILDKVNFIWYESVDEEPIEVFTRLNVGKIGLTNSELIKALFLNRSNFAGDDYEKIRLKQYEIASQWDKIEYTLQNDEFWLFLHDTNYNKPTRIEFIFDLMCEKGILNELIGISGNGDKEKIIGNDKYRTFRYFNACFHSDKANKEAAKSKITLIEQCWAKVKNIFQTFEEWYNDLELYHYVGYLVDQGEDINVLLTKWDEKTKNSFVSEILKEKIKDKLSNCRNLDKEYETSGNPKTQCKPLLLLYNIQTVINQNKNYKDKSAYGLSIFYKFPFHLYKIESWDVEHIDSNSENELTDKNEQNEFLLNVYNGVSKNVQEKVKGFIENPSATNLKDFAQYIEKAESSLKENEVKSIEGKDVNINEKNQIWNFALLDSSTNRSYGNAIFSAKRRIIIGKDKGKNVPIPKIRTKDKITSLEIGQETDATSAFIPPCTKHVFLKYYSAASDSPNYWLKSDAEAYRQDMLNTLKDFGVTQNEVKAEDNGK